MTCRQVHRHVGVTGRVHNVWVRVAIWVLVLIIARITLLRMAVVGILLRHHTRRGRGWWYKPIGGVAGEMWGRNRVPLHPHGTVQPGQMATNTVMSEQRLWL